MGKDRDPDRPRKKVKTSPSPDDMGKPSKESSKSKNGTKNGTTQEVVIDNTKPNPYLAHLNPPPRLIPGKTTAAQAEQLENGPNNYFTGKPLSKRYFDILAKRRQLPVTKQRQEFLDLIQKNQILILVGETGSGKTTQ